MAQIEIRDVSCDDVIACTLRQKFEALREKIRQRAYDLFQRRNPEAGSDLQDWVEAEKELLVPMQCDVKTNSSAQSISFQVPGFEPREIEIYTVGESLVVEGSKFTERSSGGGSTEEDKSFLYQWPIPPDAVLGKMKSELKHNLLTITIPLQPIHRLAEPAVA